MAITMDSPVAGAVHMTGFESTVEIDNVVWTFETDGAYTDRYFELALGRALAMISEHCVLDAEQLLARIAPIEFNKLGPGVLMQTNAQFTLEGGVWVPMSLAIQRESDTSKLSELLEACQYDFKITVNTEIDFVTSAHGCVHPDGGSNVALDSATATVLHELLHGLGIYSLVGGNSGGGFGGSISLYDTLLRHTSNGAMVFPSTQHVSAMTGQHLTQYDLSVAGHTVFNPAEFSVGRSLMHLHGEGVMGIGHRTVQCLYEVDDASIDVLNAIGWECKHSKGGGVQIELLAVASHTTCSAISECVCVLDQMCMDCDSAARIDIYVRVGLIIAISLCLILLMTIGHSTYMHAYANPMHQARGYVTALHRIPQINNF